ncbi:MAG: MATE family efflux transporter [Lentisphaeria bacterium]|nr:MATE family efflux transporter [Lentisphaeria bacterium]
MDSGSKYNIDMTQGPLFGKIIRFTIPLMSSYVLQMLFNTVDLIVVGRFASSHALAAVGATSGLTVLVLNIFFGLSVGVNVLAARYIGAKDPRNISRTVHTAAAVGIYGGVMMALIGILISRPALIWMDTPSEILGKSSLYMWIYCSSIPFIIFYNFGSSILRAQGDTRRPLYYMITGGIVKVLLDLLLVLLFRMDVGGVAMATLISNAVSAGLTLRALNSARDSSRLIRKQIRIHGPIFRDMVKIGLPAGIQGSFFSLSNIVIQSSINSFGALAIAGNTAAQSLEGLVYVASSSFYYTAISFVGQNHGAQKYKRIVRSIFICLLCTNVFSIFTGYLFWICGRPLLRIFNPDPEVIRWGMIRVAILFSTYFLCAAMDTISGSLRGLGHSIKPTIVTLMGVCVFRVAWVLWIFPHYKTMENLMISYPISWLIVSLVNGTILFFVVRNLLRGVVKMHPHKGFITIST